MSVPYEIVELRERPAAIVRATTTIDGLPAFFGRAFAAVGGYLASQKVEPAGPPFGYYPAEPSGTFEVAAGFPVSRPITSEGEVEAATLPGGPAVVAMHVGPYEGLHETYERLMATLKQDGVELGAQMWEEYLSDPTTETDPATWKTRIVWPTS